ncbi:MAG: tRNA (adenosine(37)-N6)-threonylcarbamoyltransferase complex ATPase subunit type 1 TsaE [Candidatus Omnitrophica bacterium]|nr:tRNA (adenosine(37)-N6)-threonylcarbamoyltransferase complex ATPase subunit type 1 TsaE [Candidatus Omnitrophota bacterium]
MNTIKKNIHLTTASSAQTHSFGKRIASCLKPGTVISLNGILGSGKTTLTKGIVQGLFKKRGVKVKSPSFTLVNQYEGTPPVYHVDCYRLNGEDDMRMIGIDELIDSPGISIIEWGEKIKTLLPPKTVWIMITHRGESKRKFVVSSDNTLFLRKLRRSLRV